MFSSFLFSKKRKGQRGENRGLMANNRAPMGHTIVFAGCLWRSTQEGTVDRQRGGSGGGFGTDHISCRMGLEICAAAAGTRIGRCSAYLYCCWCTCTSINMAGPFLIKKDG